MMLPIPTVTGRSLSSCHSFHHWWLSSSTTADSASRAVKSINLTKELWSLYFIVWYDYNEDDFISKKQCIAMAENKRRLVPWIFMITLILVFPNTSLLSAVYGYNATKLTMSTTPDKKGNLLIYNTKVKHCYFKTKIMIFSKAMWKRNCFVRSFFCLKALLHWLHLKGLSPVCVFMCCFRLLAWAQM